VPPDGFIIGKHRAMRQRYPIIFLTFITSGRARASLSNLGRTCIAALGHVASFADWGILALTLVAGSV
jgi:hypothetical protein